MKACSWQGARSISVENKPRPLVTEPRDAVVRITTSTICGSDLHLYNNEMPGVGSLMKGDILGHEAVGVVESVGREVTNVKPGDRVVISFSIACGECDYCKDGSFTSCDMTNPSSQMEALYGHRIGAAFGYSRLTGGYDGLQAEYARVPFADVNLLKIPTDTRLSDEQLLCLSDIACTGWHANELGEVSEGQTVAIWGAGPVGLMAAMWAKFRGASKIIVIDEDEFRLNLARTKLGVDVLDFSKVSDVGKRLLELIPKGLDVCIDCAGFRFATSLIHKVERALKLETDSLDIVDQMSFAVRKTGHVVLIGDYFGYGNHFPIGRVMEKSITMRGGQAYVQKYWKKLLGYIEEGRVDPSFVFTHTKSLDELPQAYKMFNDHADNAIKIALKPSLRSA